MSGEELANTIANCISRRETLQAELGEFKTFLWQQEANPHYDRIQTRLESITEYFEEFKKIQQTLMEEKGLTENQEENIIEIEESYHDGIATAKRLLQKSSTAGVRSKSNDQQSTQSPITVAVPTQQCIRKLPDLNRSEFDGQIENWTTFKTRFLSMIVKNNELTPSDEFGYLEESMTGNAARIIEALQTSDFTYEDAWDLLSEKYENDSSAALRHWAILRDYPTLQDDSAEALDDLVVVFRQELRSLMNLGQNISPWDTCIVGLLLSKIGNCTPHYWELTLADDEIPAYSSLLDFLAEHATCLDTNNSNTYNNDHKQRSKRYITPNEASISYSDLHETHLYPDTFVTTSNQRSKCTLCKKAHYIGFCPTLEGLTMRQLLDTIQRAELCLNCLGSNHATKDCKSKERCSICNELHHTLLHFNHGSQNLQLDA